MLNRRYEVCICVLIIDFHTFLSSAQSTSRELLPATQITYMPEETTLGAPEGTWCSMTIQSQNIGNVSGFGSYLFHQINSGGIVEGAPLVGATHFGKNYKFLLSGDELTVEVRDPTSSQLLCVLSGNKRSIKATGTWIWPTTPITAGADFCGQKQQVPIEPHQHSDVATLTVSCR